MLILLKPTFKANPELLDLFYTAEKLKKTVDEILTGKSRPMSNIERIYWVGYFNYRHTLEKEAEKESKKKSKSNDRRIDTGSNVRVMGG